MRNLEKKSLLQRKNQLPFPVETFTKVHQHSRGQKSDHLLRFIRTLEADIRFRYQGFTQETSQLLKKYKNYSHLTSIPGGAGVTSGKKQLTSGSGVGIYLGFTQETSQLLKKYKNYSHLQALQVALVSLYKHSSANICFC